MISIYDSIFLLYIYIYTSRIIILVNRWTNYIYFKSECYSSKNELRIIDCLDLFMRKVRLINLIRKKLNEKVYAVMLK